MAVAPPDQHANHLLIGVTIGHVIAPVFHLEQRFFERDRFAALVLIGTEYARVRTCKSPPSLAVITRSGFPWRNLAVRHWFRSAQLCIFRAHYLDGIRPADSPAPLGAFLGRLLFDPVERGADRLKDVA